MARTSVKTVFGGAPIGPGMSDAFATEESIEKVYKLLEEGGCDTIDTARLYGASEEWLGKTGASKRFTIDSKTPGGFVPGISTGENILQHAKETVERLGGSVDIYYIHAPDASVDLEDQLKGINDAYKAGYFKRFGLSNFKVEDVQRVYDIAQEKGYPLPTVYQANYSAVARRAENELVPTLRKLGIAFYVYSPITGGLLTKSVQQLRDGTKEGRFAPGHMLRPLYDGLYNKPSYYTALELWEEAAKEVGCSRAELAYRWVAFDSVVDPKLGDAVIFGASSHAQIAETLSWFKRGSVGEAANAKIDGIWKVIEKDAPLDNYNK
ncbi:NADP-dependent oxidoreductase domain-containing protein [Mycena albidolilacea]|uniref:NADP-dependent oxidoreductase domain-containing protein n=1 Tax=Mycena albidolilacea TaxID=1033008 RepID=A0AAD7AI04_9AGAR|nr:NADP-dependent oxidoreductase domain-containing protein [Mycena albidolilacea]